MAGLVCLHLEACVSVARAIFGFRLLTADPRRMGCYWAAHVSLISPAIGWHQHRVVTIAICFVRAVGIVDTSSDVAPPHRGENNPARGVEVHHYVSEIDPRVPRRWPKPLWPLAKGGAIWVSLELGMNGVRPALLQNCCCFGAEVRHLNPCVNSPWCPAKVETMTTACRCQRITG